MIYTKTSVLGKETRARVVMEATADIYKFVWEGHSFIEVRPLHDTAEVADLIDILGSREGVPEAKHHTIPYRYEFTPEGLFHAISDYLNAK